MVDIDENNYSQVNKKKIAAYLAEASKTDDALAQAIKKEKKTFAGVMAYVIQEAKKKAEGNVAMIEDKEVYSWAVHYIMEDSIDCEPKKEEKKSNEPKKTAKKSSGKKKGAKTEEMQEPSDDGVSAQENEDNGLQAVFEF